MKRIEVWVDCREQKLGEVVEKLEGFLRSLEVRYTLRSGYDLVDESD